MSTSATPHADKLRSEIAAVGASVSGGSADSYLAETDARRVVEDLRRGGGNVACSPAVRLLLALGDETLALAVAALKGVGGTGQDGEGGEAPAQIADALAESYLDKYHLSVLLEEAADVIGRLLKRLERAGAHLESDAGARDALALVGTYNLYMEEPDNQHVLTLIDEMAARLRTKPQAGDLGAGPASVSQSEEDASPPA